MKVKVGQQYRYNPVPMDKFDSKCDAVEGQIVTVVNLPGCPKANTMNHCHIEDENGKFLGMVCCNSLEKIS